MNVGSGIAFGVQHPLGLGHLFLISKRPFSTTLPDFSSIQGQRLESDRMENLRATATDGRVSNVRYRQDQLHFLHAALRNKSEEICSAIARDAASSKAASEMEFFLAVDSVRQAYQTLDFDNSLKEEYFVKFGKDNLSRRDRVGVVAIRPCTHSRFYSIVTPLAMAIAAGNCVLVEVC